MSKEKKDVEEALRDAGAPVEPAITLDEKVQILGEGMAALQNQWTALQKDIKEGQERFERILASQGTVGGTPTANPQQPGTQPPTGSLAEQAFGAYIASQMGGQQQMSQMERFGYVIMSSVARKIAGKEFEKIWSETEPPP